MYMYIVLNTIYIKEYVIDGTIYIIYNKTGSTPTYPITLIVINAEYNIKTSKY
jgi:hypothetical protein